MAGASLVQLQHVPPFFMPPISPRKKKESRDLLLTKRLHHLQKKSSPVPSDISAVLAERLRRMLKAHVRKSVGSIPTDRSFLVLFFLFCFSGLMSRMENCVGPEIEPYYPGRRSSWS